VKITVTAIVTVLQFSPVLVCVTCCSRFPWFFLSLSWEMWKMPHSYSCSCKCSSALGRILRFGPKQKQKKHEKRKQSHTHLARTKSSRSSIHYHSKFWPETSLDSKKADTTKVYLLAKRASFNRFSMRGLLFVKKVGISGQCSSALCN